MGNDDVEKIAKAISGEDRERRRLFWSLGNDFWRCPFTGRVLCASEHDNKALCPCGRTNPELLKLSPQSDETGGVVRGASHHHKRFLKSATVEEFLDQEKGIGYGHDDP